MSDSKDQNKPNVKPDIGDPIIRATNQAAHTTKEELGLLSEFIGTWNSASGANATGFNVMPLPQKGAPNGYITKNFPYYEEITFAPIAGGAPNREGDYTQHSGVLFYEQRVYFASDPAAASGAPSVKDNLIHAENGSWLYHTIGPQLEGAYGPDFLPTSADQPKQPEKLQYNKQVSVPHGNSILMAGGPVQGGPGNPSFKEIQSLYQDLPPFADILDSVDPVSYLENQIQDLNKQHITITKYNSITVTTEAIEGGGVSNILFENKYGKVTRMDTTWFVEELSTGEVQLQYVQVIWLEFMIDGQPKGFAHVDANTLTKV